jgi:hypothetical protein
MSNGTMLLAGALARPARETSATSTMNGTGYVAVRGGRVVMVRWSDVPRTAVDAVAAIAGLREAAALTTVPELRITFNKAAEHLTAELAGEVATFERTIEKATADFHA